MTKNPIYNALAALTYIVMVVLVINQSSNNPDIEFSLLLPIMVISLLTLSVAVMGYIFFYQPIMLYLDKKKDEAVKLFVQTVLIFSIVPIAIFFLYFFNIL